MGFGITSMNICPVVLALLTCCATSPKFDLPTYPKMRSTLFVCRKAGIDVKDSQGWTVSWQIVRDKPISDALTMVFHLRGVDAWNSWTEDRCLPSLVGEQRGISTCPELNNRRADLLTDMWYM